MFIELVDALRCLGGHEESWLVAAVDRFDGRYIASGSLGCPVCRAHYAIVDGAADFRGMGPAAPAPPATADAPAPSPDEVLRLRALLDLAEAGGTIALVGNCAPLASPLEDEIDAQPLLINPFGVSPRPGRSILWVRDRLPLARGALRAAAIGPDAVGDSLLGGLASALRPGGRLVAPASSAVPIGLTELARDERQWVAEKQGATAGVVQLGRRG